MKSWIAVMAAGLAAAAGAGEMTDLFNGKDTTGWIQRGGKAVYKVEGGCLVGESVPKTENSFLCPPAEYGDFVLEYDFKVDPRLNSGVQIRSQCFDEATVVKGKDGKEIKVGAKRVHGYQIEIDNDPVKKRWWTAGLYEEGCRGWIFPGFGGGVAADFTAQGGKVTKVDDWNHVKVEAIGDHFRTWLNGELRVDAHDGRVAKGFIGFQVHGIGSDAAKIGKFIGVFKAEILEKQKVTIVYDAAKKTTTITAPGGSATVEGVEFMKAVWSLWFGKIDQPKLGDQLIQKLP